MRAPLLGGLSFFICCVVLTISVHASSHEPENSEDPSVLRSLNTELLQRLHTYDVGGRDGDNPLPFSTEERHHVKSNSHFLKKSRRNLQYEQPEEEPPRWSRVTGLPHTKEGWRARNLASLDKGPALSGENTRKERRERESENSDSFSRNSILSRVGCRENMTSIGDYTAYMRLYNELDGKNWKFDGSSQGSYPPPLSYQDLCCEPFVSCILDPPSGEFRVIILKLTSASLRGTFPPIPEMTLLEYIYIDNRINGVFSLSDSPNHVNLDGLVMSTSLKVLDASNLGLDDMPDWICSLTNLESLFWSHNSMRQLPSCIGDLKRLSTLHISGNLLESFPDSIGNCSSLITIEAEHNMLSSCPSSISQIPTLETLSLRANHYTSFPPVGPYVKFVHLENNKVETLQGISTALSLVGAYYSNNQLKSIPDEICDLPLLKYLRLENNQLTLLPDCIGYIPSLIEIHVRVSLS